MSLASERKYLGDAYFRETVKYSISWTETLALLIIKEKSTWLNQILRTWLELQEIASFRRLDEKY